MIVVLALFLWAFYPNQLLNWLMCGCCVVVGDNWLSGAMHGGCVDFVVVVQNLIVFSLLTPHGELLIQSA